MTNSCQVSLITSKTRVAPTKKISLPRLELCGSLLLVQLMSTVHKALQIKIYSFNAWTDSTVTLAWIQSHPSRWRTFVANRVTKIQSGLPDCNWSHIPGVENPADIPSRGCSPQDLKNSTLWWNGPPWLKCHKSEVPCRPGEKIVTSDITAVIKQEERELVIANTSKVTPELSLLNKYSNLNQLIRVTSWIRRFRTNCCSKEPRASGPLTTQELKDSLHRWIKLVQQQYFEIEINLIRNQKSLPNKNRLLSLNPFLGSDGILRVGGRLRHAQLSPDHKNPILLPRHSYLTELLIISKHKEHLHAGSNLLLAILHQQFWIIRARDAVRFLVRKCTVCTRHAAQTQQQFMGDLPSSRVTPTRPFETCGVDYAGPFLIRPDLSRSKVTMKAYLALFVCFSTRAFHLELVSSLSTDAFLAALRRFVSRRGKPSNIHSDNGTNFVGANRQLKEFQTLANSKDYNNKVFNTLANEGINWHFNPPGAPHFGGLWEAGVKSVKFHLHRIMGSTRLTFEEMSTTLTQIEACLNSRPLTPFSSDPSDLTALTSGHFLIGRPLVAIPEPDVTSLKQNRLSRWQLIQSFQQQFWKRWSQEFLTRLQQRPKWLNHRKDIQVGDLVLIKDDMPPQQWKMARVIQVHPGADGIVRAATLKTSQCDMERTIHKLCLLPIDNSTISSDECV